MAAVQEIDQSIDWFLSMMLDNARWCSRWLGASFFGRFGTLKLKNKKLEHEKYVSLPNVIDSLGNYPAKITSKLLVTHHEYWGILCKNRSNLKLVILRYRFSVSSGSIAVRSALDFDHFNDFCVLNDPKESTDFFPF